MTNDDPGWSFSWRTVLWLLVPHVWVRRMTQHGGREMDGLMLLRQVFLSFCFALMAIAVVVAILYSDSGQSSDPRGEVAAGLLVLSAVGLVIQRRVEKPLQCEDDSTLAASYRTRFFVRIAFSEAAALFGFVGFFLTYAWWPYPAGIAIAAVGFIRAAPSRRNLARDEEDLIQRQCGRSLVGALRSASPPPAGN